MLYAVIGHYIIGSDNSKRTCVAMFTDGQAARDFVRKNNEEVQADELEIEEYPLVDDHGFPCAPRDFPVLWPHDHDEFGS